MTDSSTPSLGITWQQPTFLLPLFCLCSLLGSTQLLALAIGMAVAVLLATLLGNLLVYGLNRLMPAAVSPALWLVCAAFTITLIELSLHTTHYELYRQLGLFLPMAVISCLLLARVEMQARPTTLAMSLRRAAWMSAGYGLAAIVLGAGRELVGHGSLFADAASLWGSWAAPLQLQFFPVDMGFLMAILAPGAFVGLGLGVALYNFMHNWLWKKIR